MGNTNSNKMSSLPPKKKQKTDENNCDQHVVTKNKNDKITDKLDDVDNEVKEYNKLDGNRSIIRWQCSLCHNHKACSRPNMISKQILIDLFISYLPETIISNTLHKFLPIYHAANEAIICTKNPYAGTKFVGITRVLNYRRVDTLNSRYMETTYHYYKFSANPDIEEYYTVFENSCYKGCIVKIRYVEKHKVFLFKLGYYADQPAYYMKTISKPISKD